MIERLAILGVGLIGGSVALSLRSIGAVGRIIGSDRDRGHLERAQHLGLIDEAFDDPLKAVERADLVLIAVPGGAFAPLMDHLAPAYRPEVVYTDTLSTKRGVHEALVARFGREPPNFIPGHPIAGAETSGPGAARLGLFEGRRVILTPTASADPTALAKVIWLWEILGASVSCLSPAQHDRILAATSHLPHVLSFVLMALLAERDEEGKLFDYAAGGLRDLTRIAASDPRMWRDICLANRDVLVPLIERYAGALSQAAAKIQAEDADGLMALFAEARNARLLFTDPRESHL